MAVSFDGLFYSRLGNLAKVLREKFTKSLAELVLKSAFI